MHSGGSDGGGSDGGGADGGDGTVHGDEMDYSSEVASGNPKNYQIWFHRRAIVETLGDPASDLAFVSNVLMEDGKNYHGKIS